MTIFQRMGCLTTKMNITFSMGNRVPNTALKFFPQKAHTSWMKTKKPVLGHIFPHIGGSIGAIISKKKLEFTHAWTCINHVTGIVTVISVISWKYRSVIFQCKLKNIHEVLLLEGILIRKKILWRINFVLIKFLLCALLFEKSRNEYKNPSFLHKPTCIGIGPRFNENTALPFYIRGFVL